jgi:7,8-dihydropterin-6-yl-methyl-4-(beta-D-ribofuranosyl)aminobenzene 5'-phosphate synthase
MRITIVYDNQAHPGLKSDWGFSCLVEAEERILFDTGPTGEELIFNMDRLGIQTRSISKVVVSHNHWDHTGGLETLLKMTSKPPGFRTGFVFGNDRAQLRRPLHRTSWSIHH